MGTNAPPTTPPKAHSSSTPNLAQLSLGDTPVAHKRAPAFFGRQYKVDASRTAVAHDMGPFVHEVPYQFFQDHILPTLPRRIKVKNVINKLKATNTITDHGRWAQFPDDPHKDAKKKGDEDKLNENMVFSKLVPLINAIVEQADYDKTPTVEYESRPDMNPVCCFEDKLSRPDGYLLFKKRAIPERRDGRRYWRDIATPAEFKLQDTQADLQDDVLKICWNMHQVMLEDPRRRFVCAFTIENTQMRVWMGSRSEILVSQPFNFIKDHEKFVHFFLAQCFGKEHELGIDPTVTQVAASETERPQYDYIVRTVTTTHSRNTQVKELVYRTDDLINGDGAKSLKGRGTRIWRVHEVVNGKVDLTRSGVLKDFWVDDDRLPEGDILQEIKEQSDSSEQLSQVLNQLLLTPIAKGDVFIDGSREGTRTLITRGASIPTSAIPFPLEVPSSHKPSHRRHISTEHIDGDKAPQEARQQKKKVINYHSKFRHRIVFKEECEPLSSVTSLKRIFKCLLHIATCLPLLHMRKPGWVHRDISVGNILIEHPVNGELERVKLSDFEFAKRLDVDSAHEIRTGTAYFMAVEVDKGRYLFRQSQLSKPDGAGSGERISEEESLEFYVALAIQGQDRAKVADTSDSNTEGNDATVQSDSEPKIVFRYNPTHDLESLLWVAIYFVVNMETSMEETWHPLSDEQLQYARSLFYGGEARILAITLFEDNPLDEHMVSLPVYLVPICEDLIKLRKDLCKHYREIETPHYIIDNTVCSKLYRDFITAFQVILRKLEKSDIVVAPLEQDPRAGPEYDGASKIGDKRKAMEARNASTGSKRVRSSQSEVSSSTRRSTRSTTSARD